MGAQVLVGLSRFIGLVPHALGGVRGGWVGWLVGSRTRLLGCEGGVGVGKEPKDRSMPVDV
jgi:hypothetical protein